MVAFFLLGSSEPVPVFTVGKTGVAVAGGVGGAAFVVGLVTFFRCQPPAEQGLMRCLNGLASSR